MGNAIYATSALALAGAVAAGPAAAADKMSIGVGGYMQQWFGMTSVDAKDKDGNSVDVRDGTAQQSDSEIYFKGKLESDSGLTFSVKVELEGNNQPKDGYSTGVIDESQLTIGGEFGQVVLGAEDPASTLTHHGSLDVGITLNCGDTHKWIDADVLAGCSHNGFGTYGHGHGDKNSISYYSPRVSGVQFGATYIPDTKQETHALLRNANNDTGAWSVGGNYVGEFGGANVAFSLGHYQASQAGMTDDDFFSGKTDDGANSRYLADKAPDMMDAKADMAAWNKWENALSPDPKKNPAPDGELVEDQTAAGSITAIGNAAYDARARLLDHQSSMMVKADDKTFSNAALQVGFGAFSFGVVYATNDGGAYKVVAANRALTAAEFTALQGSTYDSGDTYDPAEGVVIVADNSGQWGAGVTSETPESATNNDPSNDNPMIRMDAVVKDMSKNWDTWGAGVKYSEGPMAVSLSHLATEWDNGDEQDATMLSMSYTLAPGVASKTSVFMAERANAGGSTTEGTAFVTGFALSF